MSWLNFNDSLNSIKGQLSNFANTVLAEENLGDENNAGTLGETDNVRENKDDAFEKQDTWRWSTDESKTDQLKTDETITNLKKKILELENENRDLISSLDKLEQNHEENNAELIKIKNKLKEELETVTEKYEVLNMRYNKLALAENGYKKRLNELKNKYENKPQNGDEDKRILEEKIASLETTNRELKDSLNAIIDSKLSEFEANVNRLENENKALKISLQMYKNNEKTTSENEKIKTLQDELNKIKSSNVGNQNVNETPKNYLNIFNDLFFEYYKIPTDDHETTFEDGLKKILNLLKNYETKNAAMETRIFELTQSRTDIQNEKNEEIERLLQNSEMLTQELLRKSQEIKDLEEECAQLMKNNDLLIGKLSDSKENTLQTIFESNEENVDTLEKEVECANQKIDELQHQLSECQAGPGDNIDVLKKIIEDLQVELKKVESERDNCRVVIDKMRLDFEVTEYQFSEMNVNLETLSEEIEKHKRKIDALIAENNDLKSSKNDVKETGELECIIGCCKDLQEKIEEFEVGICGDKEENYDELQSLNKELKLEDLIAFKDKLLKSMENVQEKLQLINEEREKSLHEVTTSRNELQEVLHNIQEEKDKTLLLLENTQKELQAVTASRNQLQAALGETQKKLEDLATSQNSNVEAQSGDVKASRDELQALLEEAKKKFGVLATLQNSNVEAQSGDVMASRDELQALLEEAKKKFEVLATSQNSNVGEQLGDVFALRNELQVVRESRDDLQQVLENTQEELREVLESRNELQKSLKFSHDEQMELLKSKFELQASLEEAQKRIEKIKSTTEGSNEEELYEITKSRNQLQGYLEIMQRELELVIESRDELQTTLEKSKEELQASLERSQEELQAVIMSRNELQASLEYSQKELQAVKDSRDELQATLENSLEELQAIRASRDELQATLGNSQVELQASSENSQKELQTVITSKNELQASLENYQKSRDELQAILENSQEELQASLEKSQEELQTVRASRNELQARLEKSQEELQAIVSSRDELQASLKISQEELRVITESRNELQASLENAQEKLQALILPENNLVDKQLELEELTTSTKELQASLEKSQKDLQDTILSRNELIAIVQTKHQETLTYHAEIQRLTEILRAETEKNIQLENQIESLKKTERNDEEIEKMNDQIVFLREKCNVITQNLLDEQRKSETEKLALIEKETTLNKNLERLQNHLMEVEEHYTQELLQSEGKIALLQARLNEVEQREKDSSTIYTSVSIRANQQNEALQQQLQSIKNQRDELKKKFMELEDENNVKTAALSNLQLVLEQFQKDKEGDVLRETERIRRQLKHEQKIQDDLRNEIANLNSQIKENKQGLQAALRLADQLETSKNQISNLREEMNILTGKLERKEEELKAIASQTDGKIDKSLIKNLIIGFVTSNNKLNKDQSQILKIIATVLDFNEQEHNRVNLNQTQQSNWLRSFLMPISGDDAPTYESLSRAFVNFLENESKPRVVPSLLPQQSEEAGSSTTSTSSTRTTPTPIVLNEIVLPTFSDFPQHRNSSSILKGVLKDNP